MATYKYQFLMKTGTIMKTVLILSIQCTPDYAIESFNEDLMMVNYVPKTLLGIKYNDE